MISTALIVLAQCVMPLLEARHDYYVIAGADPKKVKENRAWHIQDAVCWFFVHMTIAYACSNYFLVLTGLSARLLFLGVALNNMRGLPASYLSMDGIDGFMRQNMGQKTSMWFKSFILAVFSYIAIIYNK